MASGKPKKPPPPLPDGEGRKIRAFRERIAPILAAHGGVNAESQVKLRALASEMGLAEDEFLKAVSGPADPASAQPALTPGQKENLARFSKNIVRSLRKQHRDVLTPQVERTLVDAGRDRYGLPEETARSAVRRVAAENGVRAISKAEARQYIADLVRQRVGDSPWIDHGLRQRAYTEGKQWGLSRDEVSTLLSGYLTTARRRGWLERAMLGLAMVAVFAVGGLLAWIVIPHETLRALLGGGGEGPAGNGPEQTGETTESGAAGAASPPRAPASNPWWDVDLAVAIGRGHASLSGFDDALAGLQSADDAKRAAACEDLIARAAGTLDDPLAPRILREIIAGCYALDPSEQAAGRVRDALLAAVPKTGSDLPQEEKGYRPLLWTIGTAVAALKREGLPAPRADALAVALGQALGAVVDRNQESGAVTDQCVHALLARLYRLAAALAASEPALAHARYQALSSLASGFLDREAKLRLDADVLAALLPQAGDRWRQYEPLVRECVDSEEMVNVLKMVDAYERAGHPELQSFLRGLLTRRAQIRTSATSPTEVAQAVREALGASIDPANMTGADRWRLLVVRAHKAIGEAGAKADPPEKLVEQSVRLAGLSTLAFALSRRELGYLTYDQLSRGVYEWKPPETPQTPAAKPGGSYPGPGGAYVAPAALAEVQALTMSLKGFRRLDTDRRVYLISSLRRYVGQLIDIAPEQGAVVAEYLLTAKPEGEHRKVAAHLEELGRWRSIRLGLADAMTTAQSSKDRAAEVVGEVLRRKIDLGSEDNWKAALRYLLLKNVMDEIPQAGAGQGSALGRLCDAASETTLEYLAVQAQLLGAPADEYRAAAAPSARLRLLIDRLAAELAKKDLRGEDRAWLAELPQHVAVAEYLGASDLARTVLLQRLWLRLAAVQVAQHSPGRAAEAGQIAAELAGRDSQAADILVQLRDGQRATLEMWLLLSDAK